MPLDTPKGAFLTSPKVPTEISHTNWGQYEPTTWKILHSQIMQEVSTG